MKQNGLLAEVAGYRLMALEDDVCVYSGERFITKERVEGLGDFISKRPGQMKVGWGRTADFDILYVYDGSDGFGYALNLDAPDLSEWGYAPFVVE